MVGARFKVGQTVLNVSENFPEYNGLCQVVSVSEIDPATHISTAKAKVEKGFGYEIDTCDKPGYWSETSLTEVPDEGVESGASLESMLNNLKKLEKV